MHLGPCLLTLAASKTSWRALQIQMEPAAALALQLWAQRATHQQSNLRAERALRQTCVCTFAWQTLLTVGLSLMLMCYTFLAAFTLI